MTTAIIKQRYKNYFSDPKAAWSYVFSFVLLIASLVINYFAAVYAFERASNHVEDIVLSNLPTYNVDAVFIWGPLLFWIFLSYFLFTDPKRLPFLLKSISVFVVIRAFFITLTHLGPFPDHSPLMVVGVTWLSEWLGTNPALSFIFSSGSDLFFSGHTGLPFLIGLVFWRDRGLRAYCIATSIFFGIVVLLGHLHYSIDVAAAFFITYGINHINDRLWKRDKERLIAPS